MATLAADLIQDLIVKAGGTIDDKMKAMLSAKDLILDDDTATLIKTKLLSLEAAKNHPEIKGSIRGEELGRVDTRIKQFAKDTLGWTDDEYREWLRDQPNKSTPDVLSVFFDSVKKSGIREGEKTSGKSTDELQKLAYEKAKKEVDELVLKNQKTISELTEKLTKAEGEKKQMGVDFQSRMFDFEVNTFLEKKINALPFKQDYDSEFRDFLGKKVVDKIKSGFTVKKDEKGQFALYRLDDPTALALSESNQILKIDDIIDENMKDHLQPKTAAPARPGAGVGDKYIPKTPQNPTGPKTYMPGLDS